jgi:negative regulator of flagellin synthesis FlgM
VVDPIGSKAVPGSDFTVAAVTRIAAAPVAPPLARSADDAAPVATQLTSLASELAAQAPVDLDRVARIKKAVADGQFPIYPATIADRLIALKYDWKPHDDAA